LVKAKNRPGPARAGHVKIALDITVVDIDLFLLYSTGTKQNKAKMCNGRGHVPLCPACANEK